MASYFFVARDIQLFTGSTMQAKLSPIQYKEKAYDYCARVRVWPSFIVILLTRLKLH